MHRLRGVDLVLRDEPAGLELEDVEPARDLGRAEKLSGQGRKDALTALAARLTTEAATSSDQWKVKMLAGTVTDLAAGGQ